MINQLNNYFSAEKQESVIFITVGLVAIGVSAWLWMNGHRLKSMAYPLVVIALMQMVVGVSIYLRTDHQIATLSAQLQQEPAALKAQEIPRMQTVMKNFSIYKAVEMVLLILGLGMLAFLAAPRSGSRDRYRLGLAGCFDADSGYLCRDARIHLFVCPERHASLKHWAWRSVLHLTFCSDAHV